MLHGALKVAGNALDNVTGAARVKPYVADFVDKFNEVFQLCEAHAGVATGRRGAHRESRRACSRNRDGDVQALDEFRRAIDPLPQSDKYAFIDAIEHGESQASPEFQPAADALIRSGFDARFKTMEQYGAIARSSTMQNYFGREWLDEGKADAFVDDWFSRGKNPNGTFLEGAYAATFMDGIKAGLYGAEVRQPD